MALFEQDFLMRQIQYLTQILQQIVFKKNQNKKQEAVDEIQNAFKRLTRDHPKEFHELDLNETLDLFMIRGKFKSQLAVAVADLLVESGEILEEESYSSSQKCYAQALLIYKKSLTDKEAAVPLDIQQKIDTLEERLLGSPKLQKVNQIIS